jgi:hypothetical protein
MRFFFEQNIALIIGDLVIDHLIEAEFWTAGLVDEAPVIQVKSYKI